MFKVPLCLLVILFFIAPSCTLGQSPSPLSFSFTLNSALRTSAGVFTPDGTLIRTLWSAQTMTAGSHTYTWDGLDDQQQLAPSATYQIRLLSNNVTYTWEGVVGNTSTAFSGSTVHHDFDPIVGMACSGTAAYYCSNYNEAQPAQGKFTVGAPQAKTKLMKGVSYGQQTPFVTTDGTNVYWAGFDPYSPNYKYSFVFATQTSNDAPVSFAQGRSYKTSWGGAYASVIGVLDSTASTITGLAVQKTGNYLFVARQGINQIHVIHKTTGALVQRLFINAPGALAVDKSDGLWVISGTNTVTKFTVNANGTISTPRTTITGLSAALSLAISPDGLTLVVLDAGTSQQLKAYNTSTGIPLWSFGQPGGYSTDASVANDKFAFSDTRGNKGAFVSFQEDGSFWVGDAGNYRCQHFSSTRTFIETLMYLPHSRSMGLDANNSSRLFADYLEFAVDYTKPLSPGNGSWQLVKNWGNKVVSSQDNEYDRLITPVSLSNGRTYALQPASSSGQVEVVELVAGKTLRFTGIVLNNGYKLYADGSLRRISDFFTGTPSTWYSRSLTGFDASNNPTWGPDATMASSPPATQQDPLYRKTVSWGLNPAPTTSSNLVIAYEGGSASQPWASSRFHLGAIRLGQTKWLWRTASSTPTDYQGDYPTDGAYDMGNGVQYPGGPLLVQDRHLFWNYHGEFWKQSQTNKWQHVYDNGLLLGIFGVTGPQVQGQEAAPGMAGNPLRASLVQVGQDYYIYHCDESIHGGVHRWKVSGLNTVQEQVIGLTVPPPTTRGLLGQYIQGGDVNTLNTRTSRVDSVLDVNWSGVPAGTSLSTTGGYSVRWQGFVQAASSERYTFYVRSGQGVRLWVGDSLVVDAWGNRSVGEFTGVVGLVSGSRVGLRLELSGSSGQGQLRLSWSSGSVTKAVIPAKALFPAVGQEMTQGIDLLAGLPRHGVLANGMYGWNRQTAEENVTNSLDYWSAKTSIQTYDRFQSPDLRVKFAKNSAIYTVTRDLGALGSPSNSWRLWGTLSHDENTFNTDEGPGKNGGYYFDVLDVNNKVIARFNFYVFYNKPAQNYPAYVYGNGKVIAKGGYYTDSAKVMIQTQPLDIQTINGQVTIQFGPYNAVTAPVFDPSSNWQQPKTLRLYFWGDGYNQTRAVDIQTLWFQSNTNKTPLAATIVAPTVDLNVSLQTNKRVLRVGEVVSFSVCVRNTTSLSTNTAVQAQWSCRLPANLELAPSSGLTYADGILTGSVQNLAGLSDTTFVFQAKPTVAGLYRTSIQLSKASFSDPDSTPDSGTADGEDDASAVDFRTSEQATDVFESPNPKQTQLPLVLTNQPDPDSTKADLSLSVALSSRIPAINDSFTCTVYVSNAGGVAATNVQLRNQLPAGVAFVDGAGWQLTDDVLSYTIATLPAGATTSLTFRVRATASGRWINRTQLNASSIADPDSTPGNGFGNGEDDEAQIDFRVK